MAMSCPVQMRQRQGVVQKTLTTIIHRPSERDDDNPTNHQKTAKEPRMASKIPGTCLGTQIRLGRPSRLRPNIGPSQGRSNVVDPNLGHNVHIQGP